MTNNDVFRRVRHLFGYNDNKLRSIFKHVSFDAKREDIQAWLKKEEDPEVKEMTNIELANFLNGLIIERRGKREGPMPIAEEDLTNNMILQKLKIALSLTSDDILAMFKAIDKDISKHELSAFFRNPKHKSYRLCLDQYLRNFLHALQTHYKNSLHQKIETNEKA